MDEASSGEDPSTSHARISQDDDNRTLAAVVQEATDLESTLSASDATSSYQVDAQSPQSVEVHPSGVSIEEQIPAPPTAPLHEAETEVDGPNAEDDLPSWVKHEEDVSIPDEEEMKEIEGSDYDKLSATDIKAMEEQFYTDVEDLEQRPTKKLRLSWIIKGVRGTRERPNMARVMNSPGVCVDGLYWSIKFYPRGDNCSSLSAFVRCSREPPAVDEECPESEFTSFEGSPDTDFSSSIDPSAKISLPAKDRPKSKDEPVQPEQSEPEESKKQTEITASEETSGRPPTASREASETSTTEIEVKDLPNWRVSAQLGMVIYNPVEPRTGHLQSDGHQFSKHCDDWGWVNFVGPWDEIHRRKRGQRQALLRHDTLAIDAYIRIYDDPTEALWWHESKDENQWPSKELAGLFSMGTPGLYHSPAVAGITAWLLIAPFRDILQSADGSLWRTRSDVSPMPLLCQSQLVLDQMRTLSTDCYVNLYKIIEELSEVDEHWNDVKSFWEVYRRGLELEFANQPGVLQKFSSIFDADGARWDMPSVLVSRPTSLQKAFATFLNEKSFKGALPNFLPIMLDRSHFDKKSREWKLHHDRVELNDELELAQWCSNDESKFTLYGFVVHVGPRDSGKFYSVLRPGGIGTKWLAFEDGNGNKVFSYSKKRIQEFEGLEGDELVAFPAGQTRETAYMAMYVRNSCLQSYLPSGLEPYQLPKWLQPYADDHRDSDDDSSEFCLEKNIRSPEPNKHNKDGIQVELYLDECFRGCGNMLRMHDMRTSSFARDLCQTVKVGLDTTFKELRSAVAKEFGILDHSKIVLLEIAYEGFGRYSKATLHPMSNHKKIAKIAVPGEVFRIWLSVQQPVGEHASYAQFLERLSDMNLTKPAFEEDKTLEDVDIERLAAMIDAAEQESTPVLTPSLSMDVVSSSVPDEEQESVEAAVQVDVENATIYSTRGENRVGTVAASTSMAQSESSEGEEGVMTPTSSIRSNSAERETSSLNAANSTAEVSSIHTDDEAARAVVHGHLVDAIQHIESLSDEVVTDVLGQLPHTEDGLSAQATMQELSSPDEVHQIALANGPTPAERESQNRTPTPPHVVRAYGYVQFFDAGQQSFSAPQPFHPEVDSEIGNAIRKEMGFDEHREFRIWRLRNMTSTEQVKPSTTFVNTDVQYTFTLLVGDVLSDTKCEELKAAGKFWQPQQLLRYINMEQRKHPSATLTSTEAVEVADFGNDYCKVPLCRGRPHGEGGYMITSSGHTYEGAFVAGQKSGHGKMTYQNGDTYVGDWLDDERHGQGAHQEARSGNRYVGGFEKGKRWGQGITYWQIADQQADMCQICYEEEIDALFYDCGHVCACVSCARQCDTCPICRRSVRQVVKMYRA